MFTTMKPNQPQLPTLTDWSEPQTVRASELVQAIARGNAAGFDAIRLECLKKPFGYRVTFQRMPEAVRNQNAPQAKPEALGGNVVELKQKGTSGSYSPAQVAHLPSFNVTK
jgi:hypothetical protein